MTKYDKIQKLHTLANEWVKTQKEIKSFQEFANRVAELKGEVSLSLELPKAKFNSQETISSQHIFKFMLGGFEPISVNNFQSGPIEDQEVNDLSIEVSDVATLEILGVLLSDKIRKLQRIERQLKRNGLSIKALLKSNSTKQQS